MYHGVEQRQDLIVRQVHYPAYAAYFFSLHLANLNGPLVLYRYEQFHSELIKLRQGRGGWKLAVKELIDLYLQVLGYHVMLLVHIL